MSNKMRPKGVVRRQVGHSPGYATGTSIAPKDPAKLPAKIAGEHRWTAIATHSITDNQARAFSQGAGISLDGNKMVQVVIGCCDCLVDYVAAVGTPCEPEES